MSVRDPKAGERRSEPIVLEDREGGIHRVLRSEPAGFFSRRFDLSVDDDVGEEAPPRGLRRYVDVDMCLLIGTVGVPVLGYLVWQG